MGSTYVTDDQIILAQNIKQGTLTPQEQAYLSKWDEDTTWMDRAAGRHLSIAEKAEFLLTLGTTILTDGVIKRPGGAIEGTGGKATTLAHEDEGLTKAPTTKDGNPIGPCCFAAGTMVATPAGDVAIDQIKVGDIVWSKPEKGGNPFAAAVLATHIRTDQPIYRLKLAGVGSSGSASDTLLVTPGHPFYVPAKHEFVPVIDLKPGDLLQSLSDGASEDVSSQVVSLELFQPKGKTYNLTVDIGHTFYVGKLKTWVHNVGPCSIDGKPVTSENSGTGVTNTANPANTGLLRGQLAGQEISAGHAFEKHVIQQGEYRDLGIMTREQFALHIESVVNNPTSFRELSGGRTAYWDGASGTVVIRNPKAVDGGTAFRPVNGQTYFEGLR